MALPEKPKISDFTIAPFLQGNMVLPGLNPNNPNLAEQNIGMTLEGIKKYIIGGVPTSPGEWVTQPTITIMDNGNGTVNLNVSAGQAQFPVGLVDYTAYVQQNVPLPGEGLQRQDAIAALETGVFSYHQGAAGTSFSPPPITEGALLVNYVTLTNLGGTVAEPDEPVIYESVPTFSNEGFTI